MSITVDELKAMKAEKEFFIGIDSDGCAFDSMEPKHKEAFCPTFIWKWNLEAVSKYAREAWEFVNLYSRTRGCNRFLALLRSLELLREREEVKARGVEIADLAKLKTWTEVESKLGNPALEALVEAEGDPEMARVLDWSQEINEAVERIVRDVPPFPQVKPTLQKAAEKADMFCISSTPIEALEREWAQHGIADFVRAICGQEVGKKNQQLEFSAGDRYPKERILMLGDAYGDLEAVEKIGGLFFPIIPGQEEESWDRLRDEALDRFFAGTFAGDYQQKLADELAKALPDVPPWKV